MVEEMKLFRVVDMVKRTGIDKQGNVNEYYEIYFETKSGVTSSITVPVNMSSEEIEKLITQEAEKIEKVFHLTK